MNASPGNNGGLTAVAVGISLRATIGDALGIPEGFLDDQTALTDLGINLVVGGRIRNLVLEDLQLTVPASLLFGGGTVVDIECWAVRQLGLAAKPGRRSPEPHSPEPPNGKDEQ